MQTIFRPKLSMWLRRNPIAIILITLVIPLVVIDNFSPFSLVFLACAVLIVLLAIRKAISNFIAIDNRQISGRFQGQTFRILWWDVRATWLDEHNRDNPVLMLGTDHNMFAIPLRYMPAQTIWDMAQVRVNQTALGEKARQELPYWQPIAMKHIPELEQPLVLYGRALEKVVGWIAVALFGGLLWATFPQMSTSLSLVVGGFVLFSFGYLLSTYYSLQVNQDGITHQTLLGQYYIAWDELNSVQIAQDGSTVLFQGGSKRILVYGPKTWRKSAREIVMQYIGLQLEVRQIHVKVDPWLGLRMAFSNRAARIKKSDRDS